MLTDETTDLARRYLEACYNDADYQTVEELAAPEFSVYYPAMQREVKGAAEWSEFLRAIRVGLPDLYVAYEHLATQKGTAVFSWGPVAPIAANSWVSRPPDDRCNGPV